MALADRWQVDRVNWFRVLADLNYRGFPNAKVAEELGVSLAGLRGWKAGSEPAHCIGELLIGYWADKTGASPGDVPMIRPCDWRA